MTESAQAEVDLIVATIGRSSELGRLLRSLDAQSYKQFRLIVVDQNPDDRVEKVLEPYVPSLSVVRLRSEPGLSRARNAALPHIMGDIVAFPDDDCWYPPELLEEVVKRLSAHPDWAALSTRASDNEGRPSSMLWDESPGCIDRFNLWRRAISFTLFFRRSVVSTVGPFVEELGVGSGTRWGSGEESDYVLRALEARFEIRYEPSLFVYHESPRPAGADSARRAYLGGLGHGRVLRLHHYPVWFVAFRVLQLAFGSAMFLITGRPAKALYYLAMAAGRAMGWVTSDRE